MTATVNAASDALAVPSLTEITMPLYLPALAADGVPDSWPVAVLNDAQLGLFETANAIAARRGLAALGVNEYALVA